jgi:hypothetical protein
MALLSADTINIGADLRNGRLREMLTGLILIGS